jgi:glycerol-3-phosphate dehydrogenase
MIRVAAVERERFDVAIVGGGIVGCGVARDAARRGLRVALFEKGDFGSGTTSGSTRIVHGGLRYLETADFKLVRMDLRERETLLRIAPHLVSPLEFVIPFDDVDRWQRLKLRVGLALYDALALGSSLPRHRVRANEAAYHDARIDSPERLCIENLLDAEAHGARVFNYAEVTAATHDEGRVCGVQVHDRITGDRVSVSARLVVNASGPWFDRLAGRLGTSPGRIRTTKGIHLVLPPLTERALVLFSQVDGRLLFAIPRLDHTWLGTTDTDYDGDPAEAKATPDDVEYLVRSVRGAFPTLRVEDVLYTTAGVRALVMQPGSASSVSRLHRIVDGETSGTPGVVSVLGAKITGYRAIAEDATDAVCRRLGVTQQATTAETPLPGGGGRVETAWPHLHELYGSRAGEVARLAETDPELARQLSPRYPDIAAQVVFSARHEYCQTVADFVRRRSLLGARADQGWDAVRCVAQTLAQEFGWSPDRQQSEIDGYARDIDKTLAFRAAADDDRRRLDRHAG